MTPQSLTAELARYGPHSPGMRLPSLTEAEAYCRRLARSHYENFTVASWLLPRALRQHFFHIYAYCRWADDLADETGGGQSSLALLDWWEEQLLDCYQGRVQHPVFVALRSTVQRFSIPPDPFLRLLVAFRQDQSVRRYETFDELLGYCRNSANPVGELVLYLGRCHDDCRVRLSDSVCTGLQLANFWQDVARDRDQGRVYLPQESLRACGYTEEMLGRKEYNPAFRRLLAGEVDRAESFLRQGLPLVDLVPRELRVDVALFIEGGLCILQAIRNLDYDVWRRRPTVSKATKLRLLARCWWNNRRRSKQGGTS